jgi:hypothetical protein
MTPRRLTDRASDDETTAPAIEVQTHESSPDRTVFTERGNTDGWIATDLTVELER